jgi:hypothetical protein
MDDQRWVVLGLAHPRASWFSQLAKWATTAAVPIDFVKCVSANEVRARLSGGRAYSALLIGGDVVGLDRDLVDSATSTGAAVLVIDPRTEHGWAEMGVSGRLPAGFERDDLLTALREFAPPISRVTPQLVETTDHDVSTVQGRLVAVTGVPGAGSSIAAMALAQALGSDASNHGVVVLADLTLNGELAMLHDAQEIVPGLQEMVEAHRGARVPTSEIRSWVFDAIDRGYHALLGLRRHRDWAAIRPRAFDATLDGLVGSYRFVIADVDADLEGEAETGSLDVEDRNLIARSTVSRADLVIVVGNPTMKGLHAMCRLLRDLATFGVSSDQIIPVLNRSPKSPRLRAEAGRTLATLLNDSDASIEVGNPLHLPERRDLEGCLRDAVRLPEPLGLPLYNEVTRRFHSAPDAIDLPRRAEPQAIVPGSLGAWTEEAG